MASSPQWPMAFAQQAKADLSSYELLVRHAAPECHRLQFLQMACEKLRKSHLSAGGAPADSLRSHAYLSGTLPVILSKTYALLQPNRKNNHGLQAHLRRLANEIEALAPAVTHSGTHDRRDDCEYPWEDSAGVVRALCHWAFPTARLLDRHHGRNFLKLVRIALERALT